MILSDGSVLFLGVNNYGQSNVPDMGGKRAIAISCGGTHTAILLSDGIPLLFGSNLYGQCNVPLLNGLKVTSISCGF